jgi:hypothetical protein
VGLGLVHRRRVSSDTKGSDQQATEGFSFDMDADPRAGPQFANRLLALQETPGTWITAVPWHRIEFAVLAARMEGGVSSVWVSITVFRWLHINVNANFH